MCIFILVNRQARKSAHIGKHIRMRISGRRSENSLSRQNIQRQSFLLRFERRFPGFLFADEPCWAKLNLALQVPGWRARIDSSDVAPWRQSKIRAESSAMGTTSTQGSLSTGGTSAALDGGWGASCSGGPPFRGLSGSGVLTCIIPDSDPTPCPVLKEYQLLLRMSSRYLTRLGV